MKTDSDIRKRIKARRREEAKLQGFYDGRFSPKVFEDKKKSRYKKLRRKKVRIYED